MKKLSIDWLIYIIPVALSAIGSVAIFSITHQEVGWDLFTQQIFFLSLGLIFMVGLSLINYRQLKGANVILYLIGIVLLIVVYLFGDEIQGSSRWLNLGFFNLQPSEIFKVILVISLASFFVSLKEIKFNQIITGFIIALIPTILVILEPDLGTSLMYIFIFLAMLLATKIDRIYLFIISMIALVTMPIAWFFVLADYQKSRIVSFLYPGSDPFGSGYNVLQSTIAIGSGGISGKGLGHGSQSQLNFLPSQHTDFIFATIGEELGFWGASLVLILLAGLLIKIIATYSKCSDDFGKYLTIGFFTIFLVQIFVNIGMNIGIMPVTGIPLPFISYGGSSLLTSYIMIGIIQSIASRKEKLKF
jgi:rod shape determining protein RodA